MTVPVNMAATITPKKQRRGVRACRQRREAEHRLQHQRRKQHADEKCRRGQEEQRRGYGEDAIAEEFQRRERLRHSAFDGDIGDERGEAERREDHDLPGVPGMEVCPPETAR